MKRIVCLVTFVLAGAFAYAQTQPVALFYMTESPGSVRSFLAHSGKIGLLVPTWYSVDANGLVSGEPNPLVLKTAAKERLPVMPIVSNEGKDALHQLMNNEAAQRTMAASLVRESKEHGYVGIQLDFEDIAWTDRDALSAMVRTVANAMHAAGLKLTIATVPNAPAPMGKGSEAKWMYTDWRGAYDLKALGESVDFISLMTYDQHSRWTPPGPVAGWEWTMHNLDDALRYVPKEKLSLGIPLYGYHWFAGPPIMVDKVARPNSTAASISVPDALLLAQEYDAAPQWDAADHAAWFYFYRDSDREWVYYPDARSFRDRYKLMEERGLQGFSSWVLGEEDPAIWDALPDRK